MRSMCRIYDRSLTGVSGFVRLEAGADQSVPAGVDE
jgi:hypothetical protein